MVMHIFPPNTQEAEAGGAHVLRQICAAALDPVLKTKQEGRVGRPNIHGRMLSSDLITKEDGLEPPC